MADRAVDVLLIGGGIASATAAATLREEGFTGSILLVGRELDPPCHRPPATKGYLQGVESREDALVHAADWWERANVELLTRTSVLGLDPVAKVAKLSTKEEVRYEHALVATGAMVRRLNVDGARLQGLHYIRALGNADALRRELEDAERVVIVGGSYVGCEVASSLAKLGKRCAIVMLEEQPLMRQFGERAGRWFREVLEGHGIEVHGGREIERFEGDERVQRVVASGGLVLEADVVVAGVGAQPDVMLARKAGLPVGELGGVQCDRTLRVQGCDGLYAAGDMCEYDSIVHDRAMRIEHEEVAAAQGRTAARNMRGAGVAHDVVPYFFSDLADWVSLEYVGPAESWDREIVQGDMDGGSFAVWYLERDRPRAMLSVNGGGDIARACAIIAAGEGDVCPGR